jgi:hypothetical protein
MPHEVLIAGQRLMLRDELSAGTWGDGPLVWMRRLANGDAAVVTATTATRDGLPLLGGIGLVEWGASALLRAAGVRIEITWHAVAERRLAEGREECPICFGGFEHGVPAIACRCETLFHDECNAARVDCPDCGAPRTTPEVGST